MDNPLLDLAARALAAFYAEHVTACWVIGAFVLGYVLVTWVGRVFFKEAVAMPYETLTDIPYETLTEKILETLRVGHWLPGYGDSLVHPNGHLSIQLSVRPPLSMYECAGGSDPGRFVPIQLPDPDEKELVRLARDVLERARNAENEQRKQLVLEKLSSTT
jgi:hypothetical protein